MAGHDPFQLKTRGGNTLPTAPAVAVLECRARPGSLHIMHPQERIPPKNVSSQNAFGLLRVPCRLKTSNFAGKKATTPKKWVGRVPCRVQKPNLFRATAAESEPSICLRIYIYIYIFLPPVGFNWNRFHYWKCLLMFSREPKSQWRVLGTGRELGASPGRMRTSCCP